MDVIIRGFALEVIILEDENQFNHRTIEFYIVEGNDTYHSFPQDFEKDYIFLKTIQVLQGAGEYYIFRKIKFSI